MDPFTQKLLERTKARREYVEAKFAKTPQPLPRKRRSPLKEEESNSMTSSSSLTVPHSDSKDDDSPGKRQCIESADSNKYLEQTTDEMTKENATHAPNVDPGIKTRLKALAQFHADEPALETPEVFQATKRRDDDDGSTCSGTAPRMRSNRLAALAASINMWEDNVQPSGVSAVRPRPPIESNSTPPLSSNEGSSLSSSPSFRTPSSDCLTPETTLLAKTKSSASTSPSQITPKLKFPHPLPPPQNDVPVPKVGRSSSATTNDGAALAPLKRRSSSFSSPTKIKPAAGETAPSKAKQQKTKNMVWDRAIVSTLEAQGFVQSPSKSKLEYQFRGSRAEDTSGAKCNSKTKGGTRHKAVEDDDDRPITPPVLSSSPEGVKEPPKKSVKELARIFVGTAAPVAKPQRDPAELPVAARVALFEKEVHGSSNVNPKFVQAPKSTKTAANTTVRQPAAPQTCSAPHPDVSAAAKSPEKSTAPPSKDPPISPSKVGQHTFQLHRQLFEHVQDWKQNEINAKLREERQKDMDVVLNRWSYKNKLAAANAASVATRPASGEWNSGSSSSWNQQRRQDSTKVAEKPAPKQTPEPPPLPGRVCEGPTFHKVATRKQTVHFEEPLSDDDSRGGDDDDERNPSETRMDQDSSSVESRSDESYGAGTSDGGDDEGAADDGGEENREDEICKAIGLVDDYLSDENGDASDSLSNGSSHDQASSDENCLDSSILKEALIKVSPVKTTKPESFVAPEPYAAPTYKNFKANVPSDANRRQRVDVETDATPLMHTVSFYRRQKETVRLAPVRTVQHCQEVSSPPTETQLDEGGECSPRVEECFTVQEKIKHLQEAVVSQQTIMSQTSQALNLCRSTTEFHGSAQQVEGERLLLIASHKRVACMNEIQRLKMEVGNGNHTRPISSSKGSLSISELRLPLKKEFLQQTAFGREGEFVHFFLCLVKHRAQVIATQMVSTLDNISNGVFHLPNLINIRELDRDFNVVIEVYGLQTERENITKEQKTLANKKEKSKLALTPKKRQSKRDLRTASPAVQSPGGPSAVCTSSFAVIGFATVNIKSLKRKNWVLEKCPYTSPLEGSLLMKVQCHTDFNTDEQGFLTMFEDVGGFGAWHRRWFTLSTRFLSYWKYPDDLRRKEPMGRIDLCQCVTPQVGLVARDICARPHTFMLLLVKSPSREDVNSLVVQSHNSYTSLKILLSADTKEERVAWCQNLNKSLENVRAWDPDALRPMPGEPI